MNSAVPSLTSAYPFSALLTVDGDTPHLFEMSLIVTTRYHSPNDCAAVVKFRFSKTVANTFSMILFYSSRQITSTVKIANDFCIYLSLFHKTVTLFPFFVYKCMGTDLQ